MRQPDFICASCPLSKCDEKSLWCIYRFVTKPNRAQKAYVKGNYLELLNEKIEQHEKRKQYWKDRYKAQCNRGR
jgi:hypothetical protein